MAAIPESEIPRYLRALRTRSGLSIDRWARRLGFAGGSSYQRYETTRLGYLLRETAERWAPKIVGLGTPPITLDEVMAAAGIDPPISPRAAFEASVALLIRMLPPSYREMDSALVAAVGADIFAMMIEAERNGTPLTDPVLVSSVQALVGSRLEALKKDL